MSEQLTEKERKNLDIYIAELDKEIEYHKLKIRILKWIRTCLRKGKTW